MNPLESLLKPNLGLRLVSTVLLFLVCILPTSAQQAKIDSLEELLQSAKTDTVKLGLYVKLCMDARDVNTELGKMYGLKGVRLLEQNDNYTKYPKYAKKIFLGLGYTLEQKGEFDSAAYYFNRSLDFTNATDTMQLIGVYGGLGNLKRHEVKYDEALEYYQTHRGLIQAFKNIQPRRKSEYLWANYSNTGDIYLFLSKYVDARKEYEEALKISTELQDSVRMAKNISRLGLIHYFDKNYQKAIEYTEDVIRLDSLRGNLTSMVSNYNNLGLYYYNLNKPEQALTIHTRGLKLAEYIGKTRHIPAYLANIGLDYEKMGRIDTAALLFSKSISVSSKSKNERQLSESVFYLARTISTNPHLSVSLANFEGIRDPLSLLNKAVELAQKKNNITFERDAYLILARYLENKGQYKLALDNFERYQTLQDSIYNKDRSEALADMEVKYDTEKKEQQLALQQAELAQNELLIAKQSAQRNGVILAALLLIILAAVLYKNYKFKSKSNDELAMQKDLVSKSLSEKEALLKEIHHRVKNNLQIIANLLYLQSGKFSDENIKNVLEEGQGRVRSMALIHQKLYENEDLKSIPFGEYILELVNEIKTSFGEEAVPVKINVEAAEAFFDVDSAVPLGLIINELTTNAFKYAFEGKDMGQFNIYLTRSDNEYELHVSDNGKGIPEEINIRRTRSLGLRLVRVLSEQLEGEYSFESNEGMSFRLKFAA